MRTDKKDALNRLSYIEGHLKGIRKMVEEDQYCVDILKQTHAVTSSGPWTSSMPYC
jgi:CsoR family transcriptional regulator, copper-sensing transcriptional repressor